MEKDSYTFVQLYIVRIQIDKIWRIKNAREPCANVIDIRRTVVLSQCALYGLLVQGPTSFVSWNISSFVRWIIYPNFRWPISCVYICLIPDKSFSVENFAPIRQKSIIVSLYHILRYFLQLWTSSFHAIIFFLLVHFMMHLRYVEVIHSYFHRLLKFAHYHDSANCRKLSHVKEKEYYTKE